MLAQGKAEIRIPPGGGAGDEEKLLKASGRKAGADARVVFYASADRRGLRLCSSRASLIRAGCVLPSQFFRAYRL
jgi:hypothetical protein